MTRDERQLRNDDDTRAERGSMADPTRPPQRANSADDAMLSRAQALAHALDFEDYATARGMISDDCVYELGERVLNGPDEILASYAESAAWVRRTLDDVRYESAVERLPDGRASVLYTDYLVLAGGRMHRHQCRQDLTIDEDGLVRRIEHRELPGERDTLNAFFDAAGIERP